MLRVGYYLRTCPKLLYKGDYGPSCLLDPETYEWNPLDQDLKKLLDGGEYVCPSARAREQLGEQQVTSEANKDTAEDLDVVNLQGGELAEEEEEEYDDDFVSGMPGTLTDQELEAFDFGSVKIKVGKVQAQVKVMALCMAQSYMAG